MKADSRVSDRADIGQLTCQHCGLRDRDTHPEALFYPRAPRTFATDEMKAPLMNRTLELATLSAVAAFGCGFASIRGDLLFVAVFGAATITTIIEALRRLR